MKPMQSDVAAPLDAAFISGVWQRIGTITERQRRLRQTALSALFLAIATVSGMGIAGSDPARAHPSAIWVTAHAPAALLDLEG